MDGPISEGSDNSPAPVPASRAEPSRRTLKLLMVTPKSFVRTTASALPA